MLLLLLLLLLLFTTMGNPIGTYTEYKTLRGSRGETCNSNATDEMRDDATTKRGGMFHNHDTNALPLTEIKSFFVTLDLALYDCGLDMPYVNVRTIVLRKFLKICRQREADDPIGTYTEYKRLMMEYRRQFEEYVARPYPEQIARNKPREPTYKLLPALARCAIGMEVSNYAINNIIRHLHVFLEFKESVQLSSIRKIIRVLTIKERLDVQIPNNYLNVLRYIEKEDIYPYYHQIKLSDRGLRQQFFDYC